MMPLGLCQGASKNPLKLSCRFIDTKGHENCPGPSLNMLSLLYSISTIVDLSGHCGLSAILPTCSESEERFPTSWNDKMEKDSGMILDKQGRARITFSDKYYILPDSKYIQGLSYCNLFIHRI